MNQFEPLMSPEAALAPLLQSPSHLTRKATALGAAPGQAAQSELRKLLRSMNSYYTNHGARRMNPAESSLQAHRLHRAGIRLGLLAAALALASGTSAQDAPAFLPAATAACVAAAQAASPSRSGHAVLDCVGRSAQACMATPGGDTTIGMIDCLQSELTYWDRRLNEAYARRLAAARAEDAAMSSIRATTASLTDALKRMQRAWVAFRDSACLYEQSLWLGGTGGGPATLACHLHETARQALKLEGWWSQ